MKLINSRDLMGVLHIFNVISVSMSDSPSDDGRVEVAVDIKHTWNLKLFLDSENSYHICVVYYSPCTKLLRLA